MALALVPVPVPVCLQEHLLNSLKLNLFYKTQNP
jgi:hypothetical protein